MSWIVLEYECPAHGRFASMESRTDTPDEIPCVKCARPSRWVISAPIGRVAAGEVSRGRSEPPPPGTLDTRALGEGQPAREWKAERAKVHDVRRKKALRGLIE